MIHPIIQGNDWCEALYEAQAPALLLYGRALGLTHSEAEDVLHEVFTGLLARPAPPDQPSHYVVRAYRNRALNYRRSLLRRLWREFESQRWFEPAEPETETERCALAALTQLPQEQREVIVLKIWHELTFDEIGELLSLSPNTAAGRYRYGLQKIRKQLTHLNHERYEFLGNALEVLETASPFPGA